MFGFVKENPSDNDLPPTFTPLTNGLFNLPLYYVSVEANNFGHGMNAILLGDNPLEFNDWCFVEPQTDEINIKPGTWNIPYNSVLRPGKVVKYLDYTQGYYPSPGYSVITFNIDGSGNATVIDQHENLVLTRPTVSIESELNMPKNYSLENPYPNPFNSSTTIPYNLDKQTNISLDLFDIKGRHIRNLEKGVKQPGAYIEKLNASDLSSGNYIVNLRTSDGYNQSKKISLVK